MIDNLYPCCQKPMELEDIPEEWPNIEDGMFTMICVFYCNDCEYGEVTEDTFELKFKSREIIEEDGGYGVYV